MKERIYKYLFSNQLMAMLFIAFSTAMAFGTFIESWYSTDTAKIWVYNAWWFELILGLFMVNFLGNIFFAKMFSLFFNKKITDTLCGTKIFYKKDWGKLKKSFEISNIKDLWGDFDLLISAYKNNLKIIKDKIYGRSKIIFCIFN